MQTILNEVQLLIVHLEDHLVDASMTESPARIRASASALAKASRLFDLPVTVATTTATGEGLIAEIGTIADRVARFAAHGPSAFLNPDLERCLGSHRRPALIVAAYVAEVALLHTVLDALARGYRVLVPVDATGSNSERAEQSAFRQMERAGAQITATASVLASLVPDFTSDTGAAVLELIKPLQQPM